MVSQREQIGVTDHGNRTPRSGRGGHSHNIDHRASQVVNQRNPCERNISLRTNEAEHKSINIHKSGIKIGTWNVRTMYQSGKVHNAIQEMDRLQIDIMGISEMRWPGCGKSRISDHDVYYSGRTDDQHEYGVGFIINKNLSMYVTNFVGISERIAIIQLETTPVNLNIIQIYAPTTDGSEEEVEAFYQLLSNILKKITKSHMNIIMGDWNAKIGQNRRGDLVGPFGLGDANERGDRLYEFCLEQQLVVTNTLFKLPARRLYTWRSPREEAGNIIRNQIDFILINKRFRNSCTSVKTYPGADIQSDHNPLVGKFKIRLKKIKITREKKRWDLRKLKDPEMDGLIRLHISDNIQKLNQDEANVNQQISAIQEILTNISNKHLQSTERKYKPWMTQEILDLMEERRQVKNRDPKEYKRIDRVIRQQIREAKQRSIEEKCREIEILEEKHDHFNLHKKVKEAAGIYKHYTPGQLVDNNGMIIIDKRQKVETWKEYISLLFKDNRPEQSIIRILEDNTGPLILRDEVEKALKCMKDNKAPGPDNIHSELLKLLDDDGIKFLTNIFNYIYTTGNIPNIWLKSTFIPIPKKRSAKQCSEYRLISLMSHLLKIFLRVIHQRIYKLCEEHIGRTQFGFRNAMGTREALFCIQVLFQRCRDMNCDVYACFVDYQKAFDKVQHGKLVEILRKVGLDDRDLKIIVNLYWGQTANIRIEAEDSDVIEIQRGVRQGCVLSPLLFNLYSEEIFKEALDDIELGISVNGQRLNNIRYADDTVVFADNIESLQELMTRVKDTSEKYGLTLNIDKTKFMIIRKGTDVPCQLSIRNQQIERVASYTYLGTTINEDWDHSREIKCRIEKSRATFLKMSKLFKSHDLNLTTKIRMLRCYVFPVLLYGAESWTLTQYSTEKLEAFEMWLYRRILKIPWTAHVTNVRVLERINKDMEIIKMIKTRKLEYLGHIMRNGKRYELPQLVLQGRVLGRRGPGRRRISWLKNLRTWFGTTTTGLFKAAASKVQIAMMIANIR